MTEQEKVALEFLSQRLKELELIQSQAHKAVNAVLAKEQFQKWKKHTLMILSEKIGQAYAEDLSKEWVHGTFPGGDMYDELADDIEMCLRHLRKLQSDLEAKGLGPAGQVGEPPV